MSLPVATVRALTPLAVQAGRLPPLAASQTGQLVGVGVLQDDQDAGDPLGGQLGARPAVPMPDSMGQQPFGTKDAARACRARRYGIKPCPLSYTSLGRSLCGKPVVWAFGPFTEAPSAAVVERAP